MRILSGIQPTGIPHIGNYFGMMRREQTRQARRAACSRIRAEASPLIRNATKPVNKMENYTYDLCRFGKASIAFESVQSALAATSAATSSTGPRFPL
jgi:hypothetical protein